MNTLRLFVAITPSTPLAPQVLVQVLYPLCAQYSMGTRANQVLEGADFDPDIINDYLGSSFGIMQRCGEAVYRPFMQVMDLSCALHACTPYTGPLTH